MARRKRGEETLPQNHEEISRPMFQLSPGFYIVDGQGNLRTVTRTLGKPGAEDRRTESVPIRFRTVKGAQEALSLCSDPCAVLGVAADEFVWG